MIVRRYDGSNKNIDLKNVEKAAESLYKNISTYAFNEYFSNVSDNYCSKFVWQAYYFGTGIDPLKEG